MLESIARHFPENVLGKAAGFPTFAAKAVHHGFGATPLSYFFKQEYAQYNLSSESRDVQEQAGYISPVLPRPSDWMDGAACLVDQVQGRDGDGN